MRKIVLALLAILCCPSIYIHAQTNVSGVISTNTTWSKSQSPYTLTNVVAILSGVTLTIESGVTVNGNFEINCRGNINIAGEPSDSVIINNTKIVFTDYSYAGSAFKYIKLSGGELRFSNSLQSDSISIKNSTFIGGRLLSATTGTIHFMDCNFITSSVSGSRPGKTIISNSIIRESFFSNYGANKLDIRDSEVHNIAHPASYNIRYNNCILNNSWITLSSGDNEISFSKLNNSPLFASDGSIISNSEFIFNKAEVDINGQKEAVLMGQAVIRNCTINTNRGIAISIMDNSRIEHCTIINADTAILISRGTSTITNSNLLAKEYNIVNTSTQDQIADSNFWGTEDSQEIADKIFDIFDNAAYGQVIITNSAGGIITSTLMASVSKKKNSFYPNPVNNLLHIADSHFSEANIFIYDFQGKLILTEKLLTNQFDVTILQKGFYVIKVIKKGAVQPMIVEKVLKL